MSQKNAAQPGVRADCSCLNIFLFNNGQQYSPPRKYNLGAEELTWWDKTLNFLAQSQYGAKYTSIQLYTVDGKKVEGPLELRGGGAYVAVAPPAAFQPAGYHAYMMKASRSWEKRQEKRNSESILSKSDKTKVNNKSAAEDNDSTGIKIVHDIFLVPTTTSITALPTAANATSNSFSNAKPTPKNNSKNIYLKQKSKPVITPQRLSIIRNRNGKPESLPPKAKTPISNGSDKKIPNKNFKREAVLVETNSLIFNQIATLELEESNKLKIVPETANDKLENFEPSSTLTQAKRTSGGNTSQTTVNEGVDNKVEPVCDTNHAELHQRVCLINDDTNPAVHNVKEEFPVSRNDVELSVKVVSSTNDDACVNSDLISTKVEMHSKVESKTNVIYTPQHNNSVVTGSQTAENFLIFVTKGDINVKLNIEVNNAATSMNNANICRQMKQHSGVIDMKAKDETEPQSRTGVDDISLTSGAEPTLTQSWQSLTMCHCSYRSNLDQVLSITATPVYVGNNKYFVLLPSEKGNSNSTSCKCGLLDTVQSNINLGNNGNELKLCQNTSETDVSLVQKVFLFDCEKKCPRCAMVKNPPATFDNIQHPAPSEAEESPIREDDIVDCVIRCPICKVAQNLNPTDTCDNIKQPATSETAGSQIPNDFMFICENKNPTCTMGKPQTNTLNYVQQPVTSETVVLPENKKVLFNCKKECPGCSAHQEQPIYVNKQRRYSTTYDCICGKLSERKNRNTISAPIDSSTQTDWNNLLLEARLQKDGHYTLHVPPLEMLKFYNSL